MCSHKHVRRVKFKSFISMLQIWTHIPLRHGTCFQIFFFFKVKQIPDVNVKNYECKADVCKKLHLNIFYRKIKSFKSTVNCKILDSTCFNFTKYIEILMTICIIKRRNDSVWMCLIFINNYLFWLILVAATFEIYSQYYNVTWGC